MAYAWQHRRARWRWEDAESDGDSESSDEAVPEGEAAAEIFSEILIDEMYQGNLSAKKVCIMCFWLKQAHITGTSAKLAKAPGDPATGHYQRHVDIVLGTDVNDPSKWHRIPVPGTDKACASRRIKQMPVLLPWVELEEEAAEHPEMAHELREAQPRLPALYHAHPGRGPHHAKQPLPAPCGLFVDGVGSVKKDKTIGFFLFNMITQRRHLCAILRKRELCSCGCAGWCSFFAVFRFLLYSLDHMRRGIVPDLPFVDVPWACDDLAAQAGQPLLYSWLLCWIKADWAELYTTFGFVSWANRVYPCVSCFCTHEDWLELEDQSYGSLIWADVNDGDYDQACRRCELVVTLRSRVAYVMLFSALKWDTRKKGNKGRYLARDIALLADDGRPLMVNDRLEPSPSCPDIGAGFDALIDGAWPQTVVLWRQTLQTFTRHRNPLLDGTVATTRMLLVDLLHALWLGTATRLVEAVFWRSIIDNVFDVQAVHLETRDTFAVATLKRELTQYYKALRASGTGATELQDLTLGMLGKRSE